MQQEVFTPQEVADLIGVKRLTVYRWIKEGRLKGTKLGSWKIYRSDLQKALGTDPEVYINNCSMKKKAVGDPSQG